MHTKYKILVFALLITLSIASFCYMNCGSDACVTTTNMTEMLASQSADFNVILPEFELLERLLEVIKPVLK